MNIVTETRNTQPNKSDKCEVVISNPCFNVGFYPTDLVSLNSFTTESEDLISKSNAFNKTANYINKIKNPESEFIANFDYNQDKSLQQLLKKKTQK